MCLTSETGRRNTGIVIFMLHVTAGPLSNHNLRVSTDVKGFLTPHFGKPFCNLSFTLSWLLKLSHCASVSFPRYIICWIDPQHAQSQRTNLTVLFDKCSLQLGVSKMQFENNYAIFREQYGACKNHFRFPQVKCNDHSKHCI